MILTYREIEECNRLRSSLLRRLSFEQYNKLICKVCHGTGLTDLRYSITDHKWEATRIDTSTFCENCKWVGFSENSNNTKLEYKCNLCDGAGIQIHNDYGIQCEKCNGYGYHDDWIKNALL